jgi:hypothetical protein
MNSKQWSLVKAFFSPKEKWGNPNKVQWYHVHHLYLLRLQLRSMGCDWPMSIHCSYEEFGHASRSFHSKGGVSIATDFHFVTDEPIGKQYGVVIKALLALNLSGFVGLGVYPKWNSPGFHMDSRGKEVRWVRVNRKYYYGYGEVIKHLQ